MSDRSYQFHTCDVFTSQRFGGNPLAVLTDARGLSDAEMQAIAREFNFSETTFVLPPRDPRHAAQVRIFTPRAEIPFAGHPTIGTAFVLATLGRVAADASEIVLEEKVGNVPVRFERDGVRVTRCTLSVAQLPQQGPAAPPRAALAAMLSLAPEDVRDGAQAWSCGLPFLVIALADAAALARCRADVASIERTLADYPTRKLYPVAHLAANRYRVRMFAPSGGVPEDPATGSAAAAFAGWLNGRAPDSAGTMRFDLEQGIEMGRPSRLELEFDRTAQGVTAVRVGGASVLVTEGSLHL